MELQLNHSYQNTLELAKTIRPYNSLTHGAYASRHVADADGAKLNELMKLLLGDEFFIGNWINGNEFHVTTMCTKNAIQPTQPSKDIVSAIIVSADLFGEFEEALVLKLVSPALQHDWEKWIAAGASWSWNSYEPHITVTTEWTPDNDDLNYRHYCRGILTQFFQEHPMTIALGPEMIEDVKM